MSVTTTMTLEMSQSEERAVRVAALEMRTTQEALVRRAVTEWIVARPSVLSIALMQDLDGLADRRASDEEVLALIAHVRHQTSEVDRLGLLVTADLSILRAGREEDGFTIQSGGRAVAILAGQMAAWLRGQEAENYTQTEFTHYEAPYLVTVQKDPGKGRTPHGLRLAAEARAEAAEARVAELEALLGNQSA